MANEEARSVKWKWRDEFDDKLLKQGQEFLDTHSCSSTLSDIYMDKPNKRFYLEVSGVRSAGAWYFPVSYPKCIDYNDQREAYKRMIEKKRRTAWSMHDVTLSPSGVFFCSCKPAERNGICKHMAAAGLSLEHSNPEFFSFTETPTQAKERKVKENAERKLKAASIPRDNLSSLRCANG